MGALLAGDNSVILALFHEWQEALGAANSAATDEEAEPLDQRVWRLERQIYDAPAAGAAGFAVKAFMLARVEVNTNRNGLFLPFDEDHYAGDGRLCLTKHAVKGLLADAARFLSELAHRCGGCRVADKAAETDGRRRPQQRRLFRNGAHDKRPRSTGSPVTGRGFLVPASASHLNVI